MADDVLYSIDQKLEDILETLMRSMSSGRPNYSAPYNDSFVKEMMSRLQNIQKKDRKTGEYVDTGKLDFKSLIKEINDFYRLLDLSTSKQATYTKQFMKGVESRYEKLSSDNKAQLAYLARALKNLDEDLVKFSMGEFSKTPMLNMKKGMENPLGAEHIKQVREELKVLSGVDSKLDKIFYFFSKDKSERKTRTRQFIEDLADGLGKSKFVGGALSDFVRLGSLFLASWLKNIPLIGGPLAAIVVALGGLAPTLVNGIIQGLTQVLFLRFGGKLFGSIGKLFGSIGKFFTAGSIGKLFAGVLGRGSTAAIAGTAGTTVINGVEVMTAANGAALTSKAATAGAGLGLANLLGGIGKIAPWLGRIFGVVTKFLGPIGLVLTIAQLAWALFKNWDKIMETIKNGWETITSGSFWSSVWDGIKNFGKYAIGGGPLGEDQDFNEDYKKKHPFLSKAIDLTPFGLTRTALKGIAKGAANLWNNTTKGDEEERPYPIGVRTITETSTHGLLKLDQGGVPINLQGLNSWNAMTQMEAYRRSNKSLFDAYYEIAPEGIAAVSANFKRDLKMRDEDNKGRMGAVLYKGASEDLLSARSLLVEAGMSPERAAMLQFTSGIATGSSTHSKGGGHSNPLGYGFDLSTGKQWTKKDWDLALPILKQVWAARGISINYEDERGHHFVSPTAENAKFAHIHAEVAKKYRGGQQFREVRNDLWNRYQGVREENAIAFEQQKLDYAEAQAAQQNIGISEPIPETAVSEEVQAEHDERFNESGYTRIVQPDDSHIKSTIPVKKPQVPQIDYTGDEMFSDVLKRIISVSMRDPVQQ